ncbi:MAG: A/G-specific adenine glycosylase [Ruminococcus sp.]|nr:A/G-specific adenine glycosylase [Ruminococcus sp.]
MEKKYAGIAAPLLRWFAQNKRDLPWRQDKEPYHVWISEIMLQQTRIEAVMKYYARFMEALPDVQSLSAVADDTLLKLWEGLGYYSRARNLKKAAQAIMTDYGGVFPDNYEALRRLAGIGDYTAGAIASICFGERVPAVDGNVLRVLSRLTGSRDNVLLPETKKAVTADLRAVMPEQAGDFNEALMELGETVCLPNGFPLCGECPLREQCTAYRQNLTAELPVRIKKQKRRREDKTVLLLIADDGDIALEKRPDSGLLSGMYQLPNIEGFLEEAALRETLTSRDLRPSEIVFLRETKHVFTHIDWFMRGWRVRVHHKPEGFLWVSPRELQENYALPTAFRKLLKES